ncbi:MAG: transaldolase [Candidatus Omnitrophota bacterium]|nr:transaldolase [Candidatus Omnitrophota bacterium]
MSKSKMEVLADLGQSVWLDYINRPMIESGKLKGLIDDGLRGMTSNPAIFNQVISAGKDYDEKISALSGQGKSPFDIYDEITIADIQDACDLFKPVHEKTKGLDGYVSLEINPLLANDAKASIDEGLRLFKKVGRPNVMIKVPATDAGFPVVEELLSNGVNVNVTLIFSMLQYMDTAEAFITGLDRFAAKSGDVSRVASVASVFVSRTDTLIDKILDDKMVDSTKDKLLPLQGQAAVANCRLIYEKSKEMAEDERFQTLAAKGARWQRVLWGSTSTKNPQYPDVKYVAELIAPDTVNTVPEKTLMAFLDHGEAKLALQGSVEDARAVFEALGEFGISIDDACRQLLEEGLKAFDTSFEDLLKAIEAKAKQLSGKA